jgi:hypothetical protein
MRTMPRLKSKVVGLTMAAALAASPLAVISMSMVTGCGGGSCLPNIPCGCRLNFAAGLLAIWLLRNSENVIGRPGPDCWDLNVNRVCDPASEDLNADGVCDALDCQGGDGPDGQPIPGIDGIQCWDLNGDGIGDANEDSNNDGAVNALDCRGDPGPSGSDGDPGPPGPSADRLFDWFIEDFFTLGVVTDDIAGQGEVIQIQEPLLDYVLGREPTPVAFRTSVAEIYHECNPITLRVFLWRECNLSLGVCEALTLDIFRTVPGFDISRYGERRWLRLDISSVTTEPGMLVFDVPLNTPEPNGLGFAVDFFDAQMLAFEITPYVLDACYTIIGAEVFESASAADTAISNVFVFKTAAELQAFCGTCNVVTPVAGQCDDGNPATTDLCQRNAPSQWGQCLNF